MNFRLSSVSALFLLFTFFPLLTNAAPPSADIPLDSWVYSDLHKLSGLGWIDSGLQGNRPFTRLEAARQVAEAHRQVSERPLPLLHDILTRLEREFAVEMAEGSNLEYSYLKPLRNFRADFIRQNGDPSFYIGTNARQFPLNTNNFGIDYEEGSNFQATFESEARLGRHLHLSARPLLLRDGEGNSALRLLSGKVALGLGPLELSLGRQSLWWGQGRHGSLILTNNAKPLDMVRITNPSPQLLPWLLKYLGPLRFDIFWSKLEDYVANADTGRGDEPYFGGLRFDFKPLPWLELGASRTVIFGGDGIDIDAADFITILGGENLSGEEDTSNSLGAVDACLKLPFLWNAEFYGELGGEDEADILGFIPFFTKKSWLAGLYLPRIEPTGRLGLRLEHADLTTVGLDRNVLYRHSLYGSGYTYEGKILGHQAGGAAKDTYGELEVRLPRQILIRLFVDYQKRGYGQPTLEKHLSSGVQAEWIIQERIHLDFHYAMDQVDNYHYIEGEEKDLHFVRLAINGRW